MSLKDTIYETADLAGGRKYLLPHNRRQDQPSLEWAACDELVCSGHARWERNASYSPAIVLTDKPYTR